MTAKTPFDFLNSITFNKEDLSEDIANYNSWMVNKGLSQHLDTILYANEMNINYHLPDGAQYKYLLNSIRKKKRYGKWPKAAPDSDVDLVSEAYQVNKTRAREINRLLSDVDRENIRSRMIKGGKE